MDSQRSNASTSRAGMSDRSQAVSEPPSQASTVNMITGLGELFNYERIGKDYNAECLKCGKLQLKAKLNRLIDHIKYCAADDSVRDEVIQEYINMRARKTGKSEEEASKLSSFLSADVDQNVLTFIGQNALPYSITQSSSFQRLVASLNGRYHLPSPYKLSRKLAPIRAAENLAAVCNRVNDGDDFAITVEFDAWTSNSGMSILGIVLTTRGGDSALLDLLDISEDPHTAEYLVACAVTSLDTAGIEPSKLNAITSDEASNFKLSRSLIRRGDLMQHLIEYRCMAHLFNLIGASMSKHPTINRILDKTVNLINIISRTKPLARAIVNMGGGRVVHAVPTRWYSTCSAINSLLKLRRIMADLEDRPEFARRKWSPTVGDRLFWDDIASCKVFFDRLSKMIGVAERRGTTLGTSFGMLLEFG